MSPRATVRLAASAGLLGLLAPAAFAGRYVALGEGRDWAVVEVQSRKVERLHFPELVAPEDVAVSGDGKKIVLTARVKQSDTALLYSWDKDPAHPLVSLGDRTGYHADPVFSPDAQWIYFAHNPNADGRPMAHGGQAYAQIYRVRIDGTELRALTDEPGCHFSPSFSDKGGLRFVHTFCHGFDRALVTFDVRKMKSSRETRVDGTPDEIAVSPDGSIVLGAEAGPGSMNLLRSLEASPKWERIAALARTRKTRLRPQVGAAPDEVLFVWDGAVRLMKGTESVVLVELKEPRL